jgi:Ca2+-transporting ATPase
METGLTTKEAQIELSKGEFNELPNSETKSVLEIALGVVKEPMFMLLLACGILYLIIGDYREGIILFSSILIIIFITFYNRNKTEKALDALKKISSPRTLVLRDGKQKRIPSRELVMGDLMVLNEGDRISADAVVIESNHLTIDESLLTGESVPVSKEDGATVFSGSMIIQGKARAKVTAIGIHTEFGKIGSSLKDIKPEATRLQVEMKKLIKRLFIIGGIISLVVVIAYYETRGNFINSLLSGLSSAMAILPEEFPVVLTVFLALGAWRLSKKNVLSRQANAIETLGSISVLCSDKTGTITQNKMELVSVFQNNKLYQKDDLISKGVEIDFLCQTAMRASQFNPIDPMEKAILSHVKPKKNELHKTKLIKEYPLSKELFSMTRVTKEGDDTSHISCKGAPEVILKLCKIEGTELENLKKQMTQMAEHGLRVIAVAYSKSEIKELPKNQTDFNFEFLGFLGFEDPIRPEIKSALIECKTAGIKVVMITGDFPVTAKSIGDQIGLNELGKMMTGDELNELNDNELSGVIESISIFARVVPEQKLRIVNAFKKQGHVVAMTGDGVNDAPALKAAHIGIAMGLRGTDVAREAASIVLLDDNFSSIVSAIRGGRKIYDNLQKAMTYIMAIHVPIIGLSLIPAFFENLPIILLPVHIVFLELIIDPVCSIAFESQTEEADIMAKKPRNLHDTFFGRSKILESIVQGILLLAFVLAVFLFTIQEGHSEFETRAISFSALIIGNIFLILSNLSKTRSAFSTLRENNKSLLIIINSAILMLLLTLNVTYLQSLFSFQNPGIFHFLISILGASIMLVFLEVLKHFKIKHSKSNSL